jgi:AmiR/NasT family two-component response regulator
MGLLLPDDDPDVAFVQEIIESWLRHYAEADRKVPTPTLAEFVVAALVVKERLGVSPVVEQAKGLLAAKYNVTLDEAAALLSMEADLSDGPS